MSSPGQAGAMTSAVPGRYDSTHPDSAIIAGWRKLAARYASASNILGADLKNEPFACTVRREDMNPWLVHVLHYLSLAVVSLPPICCSVGDGQCKHRLGLGSDVHRECHPGERSGLAYFRRGHMERTVLQRLLLGRKCGSAWLWWRVEIVGLLDPTVPPPPACLAADLIGAGAFPVALSLPYRLVYSPHVYGPSISVLPFMVAANFPSNLFAM